MEDYDDRIDWERLFREHVGKPRKSGKTLTGMCPLPGHDNKNTAAFSANLDSGLWTCHGCGEKGNGQIFLERVCGLSTEDALAKLRELAGLEPKRTSKNNTKAPLYNVAIYAKEKGLDVEKLREWGLANRSSKVRSWVVIPYKDADGKTFSTRRRLDPTASPRFLWSKGNKAGLYGLWKLEEWAEDHSTILLVEGESDCHALWSLDIPALGVPGANTFRAEWVEAIEGFSEIAIHDEQDDPDEHGNRGSDTFIRKVCQGLKAANYQGHARTWHTPGKYKDPSDYYRDKPDDARYEILDNALQGNFVKLDDIEDTEPSSVLDRFELKKPPGWKCDEGGIYHLDPETGAARKVSATPIVLSKRVVDAHGNGESVEVSFRRDGKWRVTTAPRASVFTARGIVEVLAPLGCHITSESAKGVVRWLGALEAENIDVLPKATSIDSFGWCGASFLPVRAGDVILDLDESTRELVDAFTPRGTLDGWLDSMREHRQDSSIFRFILAAGLAAPLLRAIRGRIFFVYNWGRSKAGKTAAVKASLSAWGDPELLLTTFNATTVGLERMAGLMRDLPLGVDERQMTGGDQKRLDQIVYTLASGTGRIRGARDGGLQTTQHWRCVVLATGEEPLTGTTSQTGVSTRILELCGSPLASEDAAAAMHRSSSEDFGHVGPAYIDKVLALGDAKVVALHAETLSALKEWDTGHASSHIDGVALVALADAFLGTWFFGEKATLATTNSLIMAATILGRIEDASSGDVDETACLFVEDWLHSNVSRFTSSAGTFGQVYGEHSGGDKWLVYPSVLRTAIEDAGFSYRKTMRALDEREMIGKLGVAGSGGKSYTVTQRVHGSSKRVVWLELKETTDREHKEIEETPF